MSGDRDSAVYLAALDALHFGAVIPLDVERKPLVAFANATRTVAGTMEAWDHYDRARGVGVLTEHRYVVLDVESVAKHGRDGFRTLDAMRARLGELPRTREHSTKSGGAHLIYEQPRDAKIRSSQEVFRRVGPAPGVDIVAGNQVMRWIGTQGYALFVDAPIAFLPEEWVAALEDQPEPAPQPVRITSQDRGRRYAVTALERSALELCGISAQRNCALTRVAFRLGRLVPAIAEEEIEADLLLACEENGSLKEHGRRACVQTIRRSVQAGRQKPLRLVG